MVAWSRAKRPGAFFRTSTSNRPFASVCTSNHSPWAIARTATPPTGLAVLVFHNAGDAEHGAAPQNPARTASGEKPGSGTAAATTNSINIIDGVARQFVWVTLRLPG